MIKCRLCGEEKVLSEFYKDKNNRLGHRSECKKCHNANSKKWFVQHPGRNAELSKAWREVDPDRAYKSQRQTMAKKPEHYKKIAKDWRDSHVEKRKKDLQKWMDAHPRYRQEYQKANKEYFAKSSANYRARLAGAAGSFTTEEWKEVKARHHHCCVRCGVAEPDILLSPDHVVPLCKGGSNYIENIQPLCCKVKGNCQSAKGDRDTDYR